MLNQLVKRHRAAVERLGAQMAADTPVRQEEPAFAGTEETPPAFVPSDAEVAAVETIGDPDPPAVDQDAPPGAVEAAGPDRPATDVPEDVEGSYVRTFEDPDAPQWVRTLADRIVEGDEIGAEEAEAYRRWCRGENVEEPRPPVELRDAGGGGVA